MGSQVPRRNAHSPEEKYLIYPESPITVDNENGERYVSPPQQKKGMMVK